MKANCTLRLLTAVIFLLVMAGNLSSDARRAYSTKSTGTVDGGTQPTALAAGKAAGFVCDWNLLADVESDQEFCNQVIEKAADESMEDVLLLASMYFHGKGVDQDHKKALELLGAASQKGNPEAKNNLAFMYENGISTSADPARALALYQESADKGNIDALCNLGHIYEYGIGQEPDLVEAIKCYRKAAAAGHKIARQNLYRYDYARRNGGIAFDETRYIEAMKLDQILSDAGLKNLLDLSQVKPPETIVAGGDSEKPAKTGEDSDDIKISARPEKTDAEVDVVAEVNTDAPVSAALAQEKVETAIEPEAREDSSDLAKKPEEKKETEDQAVVASRPAEATSNKPTPAESENTDDIANDTTDELAAKPVSQESEPVVDEKARSEIDESGITTAGSPKLAEILKRLSKGTSLEDELSHVVAASPPEPAQQAQELKEKEQAEELTEPAQQAQELQEKQQAEKLPEPAQQAQEQQTEQKAAKLSEPEQQAQEQQTEQKAAKLPERVESVPANQDRVEEPPAPPAVVEQPAADKPVKGVEAIAKSTAQEAASDKTEKQEIALMRKPVRDKWALVVGIGKFENPTVPKLKFAAKDASDFTRYLVEEANFKPDHVRLLLDEKATQRRVLSELGSKFLARVVKPDDLVVLYFSTHGSPSQLDPRGSNYLVAYDSDPNDLYVSGIEMQKLLESIQGRVLTDRVLLVLDACHSGFVGRASKGMARIGNFDAQELAQGSGQLVICSSKPDQRAWESSRYQNGVFTKSLLDGLRNQQGTNKTLVEAFKYAQKAVAEEVREDRPGARQTPVLKGKWRGEDLVLSIPPMAPQRVPAAVLASLPKDSKGSIGEATLIAMAGPRFLSSGAKDGAGTGSLALNSKFFSVDGDPKILLKDYHYAIKNSPSNAELFYLRAKAYIQLEDWYSALSDLKDALQIRPNHAEYYLGRAYVYFRLGKRVLANEDLSRAGFYDNRLAGKVRLSL